VEAGDVSLALLQRALDLGAAPLLDALREAEHAGYVIAHPEGYRFAHDVVRETVSSALSVSERSRLHQALGEAMEGIGGLDPIQVLGRTAYHFT